MSSPTKATARIESWIPPDFVWTTEPDVFYVEVPVNDSDLVVGRHGKLTP